MKLELTDKETRAVGERRWFRKNWKRTLIPPIVWFSISAAIACILPDDYWWCAIPTILVFLYYYCRLFTSSTKAGKAFLEEQTKINTSSK